jgi:hypothetical protein
MKRQVMTLDAPGVLRPLAMLRAINIVQPALKKFYGSLTDEQKEHFNRLVPVHGCFPVAGRGLI